MKYSTIKKCRCCKKKNFENFFDFGKMCLSTEFPPKKTRKMNKIPMNVKICTNCKLVQLQHNYDLDKLYNKDYGYKSGVNQTMNNHLESITNQIEKIVKFKKKDIVLDIASNDGTLLKKYKNNQLIKFGIDPTIKKFKSNYPKNFLTHSGFFKKEIFDKKAKKKAKAITSMAVFYDLPDPNKFVNDISNILDKEGVWILEQSYFPKLFYNNAYDSLCHEHLTYFILKQLNIILKKNKLRVFDVKINNMNGGSIRLFIAHDRSTYKNKSKNINKILTIEKDYLLNLKNNLINFKKNINKSKNELKKFINKVINEKKIIHLYGASTKGNIILQFCELKKKQINYAADRNREKWGRITPGSKIPIISEKSSRSKKPDYYLVMPWHFKKEILKREFLFLKNGGKLIFPLPKLHIYSK
jgi:NDP-4-keto-2,6-dideoxyhexose 3-C-methyltransferase